MKWNGYFSCAFVVMGLALASCSKKDDAKTASKTTDTSLVLSGTLATESTGLSLTTDSVALADSLKVYCVSFSVAPKAGTGEVSAAGVFSVTIEATQDAVGCFILKKADSSLLGSIVFKSSEEKAFSGDDKTDARLPFSDDTNLGTISLNLETGEAVANVTSFKANVVKEEVAATAAFDFSGNWVIAAMDPALVPEGYEAVCAPGAQDCKGPTAGEPIWMQRIVGKKFTADAACVAARAAGAVTACAGTTGTVDAFGINIWESAAKYEQCGSKLGFSYVEAKAFGGVDLSASGVAEGSFDFSPDFIDGWKYTGATTTREVRDCGPFTFGTHKGWACKQVGATSGTVFYQFNVQSPETGMFDAATGKPVKIEGNWPQCTTHTSVDLGGGITKGTATGCDYNGQQLRSVWIGGLLNADKTAIVAKPVEQLSMAPAIAASGALCSAITNQMEQLRCYSQAYWEQARQVDGCVRKVETNWGANTPETFLMHGNGPQKARSQHVFELFNYTSANTGSFRSEERRFQGVQADSSWVNCQIMSSLTMSLTKVTATSMVAEFIQEEKGVDTNPICQAEFTGQGVKSMFVLNKQ